MARLASTPSMDMARDRIVVVGHTLANVRWRGGVRKQAFGF